MVSISYGNTQGNIEEFVTIVTRMEFLEGLLLKGGQKGVKIGSVALRELQFSSLPFTIEIHFDSSVNILYAALFYSEAFKDVGNTKKSCSTL